MVNAAFWRDLKEVVRATVRKEMRELQRKADGVVARAVLRATAAGQGMQVAGVDLRDGDSPEEVEHFEAYGFTSVPLAGAEGVGLTVGGDNSHRLLVCVGDRRHRPADLAAGEVAVYRNAAGHRLILKANGSTEITTPLTGQTLVLKANGDIDITVGAGKKVNVGGAGGLAISRSTDPVKPDANMIAIVAAAAVAANILTPGSVSPAALTAFALGMGTIVARPGAVGHST